jgi:molybdate transport system substrate-binding protein
VWTVRKTILPSLVLTLSITGCAAPGDRLTVFAAASLTDVLQSLGSDFSESTGIPVRFSFGGSNTLAHQLAYGAPADLFIAAGAAPMNTLEAQDLLVHGTRRTLLTNSMVLVTRSDGPRLQQPRDLLSDRVTRVAIADPALAPAGLYAQAALQDLGLWEQLQPKLVLGLDVRTSLAYVRRGEADVAVVYATDAGLEGVRTLFPLPSSNSRVEYPIAVLRSSTQQTATQRFISFLGSDSSRKFFMARGWSTADGTDTTATGAGTAAPQSLGR